MRVAIPHSLGRDEAARRLKDNTSSLSGMVPGGMADVATEWPSPHTMTLRIAVMGQVIDGRIDVTDQQAVIDVTLPAALSFVEPMIQSAIEKNGRKLLN